MREAKLLNILRIFNSFEGGLGLGAANCRYTGSSYQSGNNHSLEASSSFPHTNTQTAPAHTDPIPHPHMSLTCKDGSDVAGDDAQRGS